MTLHYITLHYFAWVGAYLRALCWPALVGFAVWYRRPEGASVDDDPYVALFSLLAVVWAIVFVHGWRSRQLELGFRWGTADAQK